MANTALGRIVHLLEVVQLRPERATVGPDTQRCASTGYLPRHILDKLKRAAPTAQLPPQVQLSAVTVAGDPPLRTKCWPAVGVLCHSSSQAAGGVLAAHDAIVCCRRVAARLGMSPAAAALRAGLKGVEHGWQDVAINPTKGAGVNGTFWSHSMTCSGFSSRVQGPRAGSRRAGLHATHNLGMSHRILSRQSLP